MELRWFSLHYLDVLKVLEDGDIQTLGMLDYDNIMNLYAGSLYVHYIAL